MIIYWNSNVAGFSRHIGYILKSANGLQNWAIASPAAATATATAGLVGGAYKPIFISRRR